MQTHFSPQQLEDQRLAKADAILRTCVHCGICTSTCPTYVTLGDELDSPRGRIYLMKDMFETGRAATPEVVKHLDRCLSCLSCMTTCPSGVHYMHLIDLGRAHIEATYKRPLTDKGLRWILRQLVPYPRRFGFAMQLGRLARPLKALMPDARLKAMLDLAPRGPKRAGKPPAYGTHKAAKTKQYRVALMPGCAQRALAPEINAATLRLLQRHACDVVYPNLGCCGSLVHHMGREAESLNQARAMVDAIWAETEQGGGAGLDAFIINASGCGTTIKDYGHMLADDPVYRDKAQLVAGLAKDLTEWLDHIGLADPCQSQAQDMRVTYHSACSMQHGQKIKLEPVLLLKRAGFKVRQPQESHLCCGSAGVYNILQPQLAESLRQRKTQHLKATEPQIIATGNIGCMTQLARGLDVPVVHTAQLLDWATGGPKSF